MMSPLPGATATKPGSCTTALPGVVPVILDGIIEARVAWSGWECCVSISLGLECCEESGVTTIAIWSSYWAKVPGKYLTGDNARIDEDGYYWIMGRIDDVINVSGHRTEYDRSRERHRFP